MSHRCCHSSAITSAMRENLCQSIQTTETKARTTILRPAERRVHEVDMESKVDHKGKYEDAACEDDFMADGT